MCINIKIHANVITISCFYILEKTRRLRTFCSIAAICKYITQLFAFELVLKMSHFNIHVYYEAAQKKQFESSFAAPDLVDTNQSCAQIRF